MLHAESQLFQHPYGPAPAAFEVAGREAATRGELVGRAQDGLRRIAPVLPDQIVGGGGCETVFGEELLRAEPVILRYRAQHLGPGHLAPVHRMWHRLVRGWAGPGRGS